MAERRTQTAAARRERRTALMRRVQEGDRDAYRDLIGDLRPALRATVRAFGVAPHEVDDVYQDCLLALHRARHTHLAGSPVEPWLFAIARRIALRHVGGRARRIAREILMHELPERPAEARVDEPLAALEQALADLPPAQREALEMLKLEGLSVAAAAERAGTTQGALRVRAHRAYRALKERLLR
jgi:RNA polymerase sigma-70 factor (ECF subfamily)